MIRRPPRSTPPSLHDALPICLDIKEIKKLLPHRYPFLLVDKVEELEPGKRIVAYKNVTINEGFFQGHFPEEPVRSEEHTSELQSRQYLVCRLLLEKKNN